MNSHDVRHLRHCQACQRLGFKRDFLDHGTLCVKCAWEAVSGLDEFMSLYPRQEWERLSLDLVGVAGMRRLLSLMATDRP